MNRRSLVATLLGAALIVSVPVAMAASTAAPLKKGLKVFVIPKNLGNPYFTTADSVKSGGALAALKALGEKGTETSGTAATAASQIPAIQAAITKGANALRRLGERRRGALSDAEVGDEEEDHRRHLRLRRAGLPQPLHQPGRQRSDRPERGRPARQADRQDGRDRDPVGRRLGDEPERLDRLHEGAS